MADYAELRKRNMDEYSKVSNAIADYITFLKDERGSLSREEIRDRVKEIVAEVCIRMIGGK